MRFRASKMQTRTLKNEIAAIESSLSHVDLGPLRERYASVGQAKYFDLKRWIPYHVRIVRELALFDAKPIATLDIACGGGLLIYCLGYYGHRALGIDRENQLFADMADALGVERRVCPVKPLRRLEPLGMFDLITVVSPGFDYDWGANEWNYFLDDVSERLNPGGRLYIRLNHDRSPVIHAALACGFAPPSKHTNDRREFIYDHSSLRSAIDALAGSVRD